MLKRIIAIGIVVTLCSLQLNAAPAKDSTAKIVGKVQFKSEKRPDLPPMNIGNAEVWLYYQKDGRVDSLFTTTDIKGNFYLRNIRPQRIGIKVHYTGYEPISGVYEVEAGDNVFYFTLKRQVKTLDAAKVVAEIPLIKQIQDTTVYNTQAVKTVYDESLRGVLEQLPGFKLTDDGITVDGEKVKRTYVNGTLVFGDRVTSAIDALKADEVTQVKVYDELSAEDRHRGNHNARKVRVLDIITKDKLLKMDLASAGIAAGADFSPQARYAAAAAAAHHSEKLETHVMVSTNNINLARTPFISEARIDKLINQTSALDSYKEITDIKLSADKFWKSRDFGNKATLTYTFANVYSKSASTALKEYFEGEGTPAQTVLDTLSQRAVDKKHRAKIEFTLNDTPLKSIFVNLEGGIGENSSSGYVGNLTKIQGYGDTRIHQNTGSDIRNYDAMFNLSWTNKDNVKWEPLFGLSGSISNSNALSWNVDTAASSFLKRDLSSDAYGRSAMAQFVASTRCRLVNTEAKTSNLSLHFVSTYNFSRHKQISLDEYNVPEPVMDIAASHDYTRNQLQNTLSVEWDTSAGRRSFNSYIALVSTYLFNKEIIPTVFEKNKPYTSLEFGLFYQLPDLLLRFGSFAETPSIEQISNRVSDANPLSLVAGNPNLKQAYKMELSLQYKPRTKKYNNGAAGSFSANLNANYTFNPMVQSVRYFSEATVLDAWDGYVAQPGAMLHSYDNSKMPRWMVNASLGYSIIALKNRLNVSFSLNDIYNHGPLFYGGEIVPIDDNSTGLTAVVTFKPSKSLSLMNSASAAYIVSSREGELLSGRMRFGERFNGTWFITKRIKLGADYSFTGYNYTAGLGRDHYLHILNSGIDFILLKDSALTVGLWGYDLLNSGSLYTTEINSAMMSQTWTPTYGRNLMFKIIYTFRKK